MELTILEIKIIQLISDTVPYAFDTCKNVYLRLKSLDKTIELLNLSSAMGLFPGNIIYNINKGINFSMKKYVR